MIERFTLHIRSTFFRLFEWIRVVFRYYPRLGFCFNDCFLTMHYLFRNPHRVSKAYLAKRGETDLYVYGETPLTTLDRIAKECRILSKDVVYELGCGTGRTLFWLRHFVQCQAIGIDYNPIFIRRANRVRSWLHMERISFQLDNMLHADFKKATVLYLYGTCLDEETIAQLVSQFERLPAKTKVITVSYPLTEYSEAFNLAKCFPAPFPWGKAYIFLNIKN